MKKLLSVSALILSFLFLSACGAQPLPKGVDENKVTEEAKRIVTLYNTQEFDALADEFREDLHQVAPSSIFKESFETYVAPAGDFVEFKQVQTLGQTDKSTGEEFAVAIVVCTYAEKDISYSVTFTTDMVLIGFRIVG